MKATINEVTGAPQVQMGFTFKSISDTILENSNGKKYRIVNGTIKDKTGKEQLVSGMMYEGNYTKASFTKDEVLLAVATKVDKEVYLQVSHLPFGGSRPTLDMFAADLFDVEETPIGATASVSSAEVANAVS